MPIEFWVTSKGNGSFSFPEPSLVRVYDKHDDTICFKSVFLNNQLLDIVSDGYREILLWGVAIKTHEKTGKVLD